jgi:hypothetical protein
MPRSMILSLIIIAGLVLKSAPAVAHGGGLDTYGCHTNHKTGDYHCHNSGRSSSRTSSYSTYSGYSTPNPVRVSLPSRAHDFSCLGPSFQDPNDTQYHYCKTVDGYGINHNGVMTGVAKDGSEAAEAIRKIEPSVEQGSESVRPESVCSVPKTGMGDGDWDDPLFFLALSPWAIGLAARFVFALFNKKYGLAALSVALSFGELLLALLLSFITGGSVGIPAAVVIWGGAYLLGVPFTCVSIFMWVAAPSILTISLLAVFLQGHTAEVFWREQ